MLFRDALLGASRNERVRHAVQSASVSKSILARYLAGEHADDAISVARALVGQGLLVTVDHVGEDIADPGQAEQNAREYVKLLGGLSEVGLSPQAELSVKPSAIGSALAEAGEAVALTHARRICQAARNAGSSVTLDMESHASTDATLRLLAELRLDYPSTGAVLQAGLHRSEGDCRDLAVAGSRVRLCKGAYREPPSVAFQTRDEIDRAYVRCMRILMAGAGYPMIATHDPRLIEIAAALAKRYRREQGDYEFQMLYGVRPDEQRRLAGIGERVRVYVPYGAEWYGYMMRRMADRPANLALFLRSFVSGG